MEEGSKRKARDAGFNEGGPKKTKKQWQVPRKNGNQDRNIQPGESGIWATCDRGRERKCVHELRDLFNEYAENLYQDADVGADNKTANTEEESMSIEDEIKQEIKGIKKPKTATLFTSIDLDVQCVIFFKTVAPVEPVSFVHRIMQDAADEPQRKRTRFTNRLVPMTLIGRASDEGLAKVATEVLAPHFHAEPVTPKRFAIRPTVRNHNVLKRDAIIKQVATAVGPPHPVDLKNYDLLILVEFYKNVCGMAVVPGDFEKLKRYNLAEIFDPTAKGEVIKAEPLKEEILNNEAFQGEATKPDAILPETPSGEASKEGEPNRNAIKDDVTKAVTVAEDATMDASKGNAGKEEAG